MLSQQAAPQQTLGPETAEGRTFISALTRPQILLSLPKRTRENGQRGRSGEIPSLRKNEVHEFPARSGGCSLRIWSGFFPLKYILLVFAQILTQASILADGLEEEE